MTMCVCDCVCVTVCVCDCLCECVTIPGQEHIPIAETRNKREGLPRAR